MSLLANYGLMGQTFTPNSIANLVWWHDLSYTPYVTVDGSNLISLLKNRTNNSVYDLVQGGSGKPTRSLDGTTNRYYAFGDGTNDYLGISPNITLTSYSAFSYFTILEPDAIFLFGDGSDPNNLVNIRIDGTTIRVRVSNAYGEVTGTYSGFNYLTTLFDGSASGNSNRLKVYLNGVQQTLTFTGTIPASTYGGSGNLQIVGRTWGGSVFTTGKHYEQFLYSRVLDSAEITKIENYINNKY